jgi:hypothetical protein
VAASALVVVDVVDHLVGVAAEAVVVVGVASLADLRVVRRWSR